MQTGHSKNEGTKLLSQVFKAAKAEKIDYTLLATLANAAANETSERTQNQIKEIQKAIVDLRECGIAVEDFKPQPIDNKVQIDRIKTKMEEAVKREERKVDLETMAQSFLQTRDVLEKLDKLTLHELNQHYIELQNSFGIVEESVSDSTEIGTLQSSYKHKLKLIDQAILNVIEKGYFADPTGFTNSLIEHESSLPILERIITHLYTVALNKGWENDSISATEELRAKLSTLNGGMFKDRLEKKAEEFIRKQGNETLRKVRANELPDAELRAVLDRIDKFTLSDLPKEIRLRILSETSLSNFTKLLAVRSTFINYFLEETITQDEFKNYIEINAPGLENGFRLLGLENQTQNRFLVERYILTFYSTMYQLINFLAIDGSPIKPNKFKYLERVQRLFFERLKECETVRDFKLLLEMHAHSSLIVLDQMHRRKTVTVS